MKHMLRSAVIGLAAAAALTASASAASFDHCADSLKSMGLFQGTSSGYQLDKTATRAEAATMLVRLLGKEADAQKLEYKAPFTDLADWQKPYVEYLYENGLTSGTGATTFSPQNKCSAQMYSAFLMRALGYSEGAGDFTYSTALDKATALGVADAVNCNKANFLRDNVVAMSYTALDLKPKDGSADTLLQKLVNDGAVDAKTASGTMNLFQAYGTYNKANQALQDGYAMTAKIHADITVNGASAMTLDAPMDMKAIMNQEDLDSSKMAMTGTLNANIDVNGSKTSISQQIEYYYTNGMYYMSMAGSKIKEKLSLEEAYNQLGMINNSQPISMIKNISVSGNTVHMEYAAGALNGMINNMMSMMDTKDESVKMNIGDITVDATLSNGIVKTMKASFAMSMDADGQPVNISMTEDCAVTATGSSVTVTLPTDLDSYTLVDNTTLTTTTK